MKINQRESRIWSPDYDAEAERVLQLQQYQIQL